MRNDRTNWPQYLTRYHNQHPAITEQILTTAVNTGNLNPYQWLQTGVVETRGVCLDLACGSAPLASSLSANRVYIGIDRNTGELASARTHHPTGRFIQADATGLPLPSQSIQTVICSMALMLFTPLRATLAEISRILEPDGQLIATYPTTGKPTIDSIRLLLPTILAIKGAPKLAATDQQRTLATHSVRLQLSLQTLETETFNWTLTTDDHARQLIDGLYLPNTSRQRKQEAINTVQHQLHRKPKIPIHLNKATFHKSFGG